MLVALLSFTLAAVLLILLPGPDTLVVIRGLVRGGRGGGLRTTAGVLCGLVVWVAAASLGLSALLRASEIGYNVLKIAGAGYLIWMGAQSLRSVLRPARAVADDRPQAALPGRSGGFVAGLLTDLLNPKIGVLFVTFLPGFVPDGYSVAWTTLGLGGLYIALSALYCAGLVAAAGRVTGWMQAPRIRRRLDAIAGLVLVGFGVRLATEA
ncbi:LysE family translocator [Nocardia aurantia]|uniref:Threonine efflux protein n=1 Tax=Nocardia aurantia TaxID=2585199 RepID=A0A7K0DRY8_9NOCA|nr:LysE family translocator [Nocardia aurantia]MQY28368.1 Threonine efflux protein [Nocardia aurantia]